MIIQVLKNIRNVTRQEWPKRKKQANKMGMAVVNFHHAYSSCGDTLQQLPIPVCMAC